MNFNLMPSLKHIAYVKIAASLWNGYDIRALMTDILNSPAFLNNDEYEIQTTSVMKACEWQKVENKVMEKLLELPMATSLKSGLSGYIQAMGFQILGYFNYHCSSWALDLDLDPPKYFCWTSQGIIDKKKTAELLINDDNIDINTRYKLACIYCLEDDVVRLWSKLSENDRKGFRNTRDLNRITNQELVVFWTDLINEEMTKFNDMIRRKMNCNMHCFMYALQSAAMYGNKVATEFFLQKLPNIYLPSIAFKVIEMCEGTDLPGEYYGEVLFYLLSRMTLEQQKKIYKRYLFPLMKCVLDWPWKSLFLETAKHLWEYFSNVEYYSVLIWIIRKIKIGDWDYNYQKLFTEFWNVTPNSYQSFIINDPEAFSIVLCLLDIKNTENIKVIFRNATPEEKSNLIFSDRGTRLCQSMMVHEEWDLLKYFIQHCITSKDDLIKFKENKETALGQPQVLLNGVEDKLGTFFQLLDKLICGDDEENKNKGKFDQAEI